MRTIAQHIDLMEHAVGATPDSRHNLYHSLNRAGRILTRLRCWWWRLVPAYSLAAVSGSADITLPSDFETLDTITVSSGLAPVVTLTPAQFTHLKSQQAIGMTEYGTQVLLPVMTYSSSGAETKVLRMLSAASANGSPTFLLTYYRGWVDVSSSDDSDTASIPADFDDALMLLARACALDLQDQTESHEMSRFNAEIATLIAADQRKVPEFSAATGGARSRNRRSDLMGSITF